ncbi:TetR family transcriptional regulator [Leekyejoonella antrihumi]|uniref:TetR family transcriptional regulator n=1 Tax=Leekyejoonella antrihumi TaxID=1660198 RepID=A0A563EA20_9MICO|nr:TetR family transcriptional regulator [Leekyejoonella antrihumi]TWP39053.1 TetR family transcriptional regulator [Leekyejoonella antrihumi]
MAGRILRADILRVAIELLDRGGLPALVMRRIAAELDVQQSALYWHFRNKQELLAALADQIIDAVAAPTSTGWPSRLEELCGNLRAELLEHKDGADLVATAFAFRLGAGEAIRRFEGELDRAGLSTQEAQTAASVLLHYVLGYTTNEQQHRQAADLGALDPQSMPHDRTPFGTEDFLRGVRLVVRGIGPAAADG